MDGDEWEIEKIQLNFNKLYGCGNKQQTLGNIAFEYARELSKFVPSKTKSIDLKIFGISTSRNKTVHPGKK